MIRTFEEVFQQFGPAACFPVDRGEDGFACLLKIAGTHLVRVIASWGDGFEHVSVSLQHRCPTWEEMSRVKEAFWPDTDCVMQLHPPKANYVNFHPYCLHLWRPIGREIPQPPTYHVGPLPTESEARS